MLEIEDTIGKIEAVEKELADHKIKLMGLELARDVESAKLQSKSKEEWKELGITNAEGRKAHIDLELLFIKKEILGVKTSILRCEVDLRNLNRSLDFKVWKYNEGGY
ncbi:MAG: hypothetical protein Q4P18_07095 [Methanobrevibacter sp.]|uniref:hypothetical protein n=1 Tax=Methanobrevibacter sp. TaxID=66852 RepID=UPI0026E093B1|nr:hypothetical protein [Methanobrevibacter sp.]MDO5849283.1 hypothetical protein [Methanobrevibacter sp.]